MERRFGVDFRGVRVHTDSNAVQMNKELNAQAFTYGRDIYFGAGRYNPGTSTGKRLLAHELTHVVQQNKTQGSLLKNSLSGKNINLSISFVAPKVQLRTIDGDFGKCKDETSDRKDMCLARGATACAILAARLPFKGTTQGGLGGICFMFYTKACQKTYYNDISFCKRKRKCLKNGIKQKRTPDKCEGWLKGWLKGGSGDPWPDFKIRDWYDDWGKKPKKKISPCPECEDLFNRCLKYPSRSLMHGQRCLALYNSCLIRCRYRKKRKQ